MKVGIKLVKVKKFGIGWCIPHRVVAENAEGGFVRTPPPHGIGLSGNLASGNLVMWGLGVVFISTLSQFYPDFVLILTG